MSVIYILVGASVLLAIGFLLAFLWAMKSGQYEDSHTPSIRILFDNPSTKKKDKENGNRKI